MVVVDKLSKASNFICVKTTYKAANIADIFIKEIFHLHGIPKMIIFYRDPKFTGNFCVIPPELIIFCSARKYFDYYFIIL